MAEKLGTKGYISSLERVKNGPFEKKESILLENLKEIMQSDPTAFKKFLLPIEYALDDIPAIYLEKQQADDVRYGRKNHRR